jgi:signal transduction histidine kinase
LDVVRDHEVIDAIARARRDSDSVAHVERTEPPRFQRIVARRLADGELLLVIQDLTNLRRLQTVRRDFVANVSHELRTPLASLKAMAETLEAGAIDDTDAARDFVREQQKEEVLVRHLLLAREREAIGQRVEQSSELQASKRRRKVGADHVRRRHAMSPSFFGCRAYVFAGRR